MKKYIFVIAIFLCQVASAQLNNHLASYIKYVEDYYSNFQTGYDSNGKYKIVSNNYKAIFSDSIFTLTFDVFDDDENFENQKITFNLKDVVSIESYGGDVIEIVGDETITVPISLRLGFKIKEEEVFGINIYFNGYEDVTTTEIYKAFESVWKYYQSKN